MLHKKESSYKRYTKGCLKISLQVETRPVIKQVSNRQKGQTVPHIKRFDENKEFVTAEWTFLSWLGIFLSGSSVQVKSIIVSNFGISKYVCWVGCM